MAAAVTILAGAVGLTAQATHPVRWLPAIGPPDRAVLEAALKKPPIGLAPDDALDNHDKQGRNHPIRTCDAYAAALKAGWSAENNAQMMTEGFFIRGCDLVRLVLSAKPSRVSYLADLKLDASALAVLPPSIDDFNENSDAVTKAEKAGRSLKQFNPALKVADADPGKFAVQDETSRYVLEIVAYGDFDGDGVEDVLLFQGSYAVGGSMHAYSPVILTRTRPTGVLSTVVAK
jgi:hypothetical protein